MTQPMPRARGPQVAHLFVATLGLTLCTCSPLDIPEGPELTELAEQYDDPDGSLPEDEMEEVAGAALEKIDSLNLLGRLTLVSEALTDAGKAIQSTALTDGKGLVKLSGVSEVKVACPGHGSESNSDGSNGDLSFTATIEDSYIDSTVWGQFEKCRLSHGGRELTLDTSMDLYLGEAIALAHLRFKSFLFRLNGDYTIGGRTLSLELDFRVLEDAVEFRVPVRSGDVVFVLANDLKALAVRTKNNSFCCDFEERVCSEITGDTCGSAKTGTRITW